MNILKGYNLDVLERKPVKEAAEYSRIAASEGIVLLKNENVLPFDKSKTISVFGRTQIDYVKSGTGSGGLVNTEYTVNILDGLKDRININQELLNTYTEWLKENPFDVGEGWAKEPWAQKEMPVTDELCEAAANKSDYALIVIGRTAGEDRDNSASPESYLLSPVEEALISTVARHFDKLCVALNTGNIIDMKWVEKFNIPCVLYCWQGGMEGGYAFADVVLGDVTPSGKLTDTIAYDIEDYPSTKNHGNDAKNIYAEDIYVGYRYFETFARDKVLYPFGFGLSYTKFEYDYNTIVNNDTVKVSATVKNIGKYSGKETIQVYYCAPQGTLGNPVRQLIRYAKTDVLKPGDTQTISIEFSTNDMASYDDKETYSYVLESGRYAIYVGVNVRDAQEVLSFELDGKVVSKRRQALAPVEEFMRIKPQADGVSYAISSEPVPTRSYDIGNRKKEHLPDTQPPIENKGIALKNVLSGDYSLDEFVAQLSVKDLSCIVKGEGLNSPKGRAGTVGVFGGITDELLSLGITPTCCTDGPSGIRIDTGDKATLMPNGTCLACTWNDELVKTVHSYIGIELRANDIDILLAPGINIHRNPLNGRNFEYFSEDPVLTGNMAAACMAGLADAGVSGTLKHFACNSQEHNRHSVDSVVSERALREIYLKPFEIAVRSGKARSIMTGYNLINGTYCASNYDLCTSILRDEWGYDGFVMTDWWTCVSTDKDMSRTDLKSMVEAQNDIYMVINSSAEYPDNLQSSVEDGTLDISYLRRCAKNLIAFILNSTSLSRKPRVLNELKREDFDDMFTIESISPNTDYNFKDATALELEFTTSGSALAQYVINILSKGETLTCALTQAATDKPKTVLVSLPDHEGDLQFDYASSFNYMKVTALK